MRRRSARSSHALVRGSQRKRLIRLGTLLAAGAAGSVQAATITVNSTADTSTTDSQCTLREALANANANSDTTGGDCVAGSGSDLIQFSLPNPSTITLGGTQLSITDSATINGPGASALTVSGNNASRVFYIYSNSQALSVTISALTLTGGNNVGGSAAYDKGENLTLSSVTASANTGDAIRASTSGSLTLQSSTVSGTIAGRGVKADHIPSVTITGSTLTNNSSAGKGAGAFFYQITTISIDNTVVSGNTSANRGGGLFLYQINGAVSITNSQITGNSAGSRGGGLGLYKIFDNVTIQNTTISGNTAANRGGGIFFYKQSAGKTMTIAGFTISGNITTGSFPGGGIFFYKESGATVIEDTTISGNTTTQQGGGIFDYNIPGSGSLVIRNSTINGNTAAVSGGNVKATSFPSVVITNSIVANGVAPASPDMQTGASNVTVNFSLLEDTTGATFTGANNLTGVDPQLAALANNGGPTQTHLPAISSPVINAGDPAFAPPPATDQRGFARTAGTVDMGSVEYDGGTIQLAPSYSGSEASGTALITISRSGGTDAASVGYATSNGAAFAPGDYTTTTGSASFAAGATSATFNVPITDDSIYEGNQTFNVTLTGPSPGASLGAQSSAVTTITDNDAAPSLSINSVSQAEGNSGTTPFNFTVGLTGATELTTTVQYATANGTAVAPGDFTAASGTLTFNPGVTTQPIPVAVNGDTSFEPNETFSVNLTVPVNATIGTATGTGTIQNDDAAIADLSITKTAVGGPFVAGQPMTYNITVTNAGPNGASAVVVTDVLPANTTFGSATPSQGSCTGTTTVTCSLGAIANGGSATIALTVTPTLAGQISNTATVSNTPETDPNPANGAATAPASVSPSTGIPVLDGLGKALLMITTALLGLFMARKPSS